MQRVAEAIERIADVDERGDAEVARQVADQFGRARHEMPPAHLGAAGVGRRQVVIAEAPDAAVAAGEEALGAGQVGGIGNQGGAHLAANQCVPARTEVEHALGLEPQLQVALRCADLRGRAAQLGVQRTRKQCLAEITARHGRETDTGNQQRVGGALRDGRRGWIQDRRRARDLREQHALPGAADLRDARLPLGAARIEVADVVAAVGKLEAEFLECGIANRHDITRSNRLLGLGRFQFRAQPVAAAIEATVLPAQRAAQVGVGAIAEAECVAIAPVRLGADPDRH